VQESSPDKENIVNALRNSFGRKKVLVVGDIMLDRYLWGTVERISPEAPTPVLRQGQESWRAGGAGNVALNLAGLGLDVSIAGFVGDDGNRDRLMKIFADSDVDTSAIVTLADRPTTTKTRVIAGHQHVLRLDTEDLSEIGSFDCESLSKAVTARLEVDAIVLADYAKGAMSLALCQEIIIAARRSSIPVIVNPKGSGFSKYVGASVLTPNLVELSLASGVATNDIDNMLRAASNYLDTLHLQFVALTRGADGTTLIAKDQVVHSPAKAREVFDVSGAGDTVVASVAAAMLGGLDYVDTLHMVNLAAGVVVGRIGTAAIDQTSLMRALHADGRTSSETVHSVDDLLPLVAAWRSRKQRIVYAQGHFDGVRAGDVDYLQAAALEGDNLIVGVTTNDLAGASGNESLTRNSQEDRAAVVAALVPVDAVILCDEKMHLELIRTLQPDVFVQGAGASEIHKKSAAQVESYGGRVESFKPVDGNKAVRREHKEAG